MASPDQTTKPQTHVISEEADRKLFRIMRVYGIPCFLLFIVSQFGAMYLYARFPHHRGLVNDFSMATMFVLLAYFYAGIHKLYSERLSLGREFVEQQRWREAVASLDPFAGWMQRQFDRTGEAHYLLAKAYAGVGNKVKAESARTFVLKKRPGEWADKLQPGPAPRASQLNRRDTTDAQESKPRPVKTKPRRRF